MVPNCDNGPQKRDPDTGAWVPCKDSKGKEVKGSCDDGFFAGAKRDSEKKECKAENGTDDDPITCGAGNKLQVQNKHTGVWECPKDDSKSDESLLKENVCGDKLFPGVPRDK